MVIISFFHLYKIRIFPKLGGCGSKNELATPFWILNFKWAWQAQFLSHNLLILQNCIFFVGKQMILVSFAKIHKGIKVTNFGHSCHIHVLSHPCRTIARATAVSGIFLIKWYHPFSNIHLFFSHFDLTIVVWHSINIVGLAGFKDIIALY